MGKELSFLATTKSLQQCANKGVGSEGRRLTGRRCCVGRARTKKLGGNADVFENKRVAKRAICKCMKMRGMEIDGVEMATHNYMKVKGGGNWVIDRGQRVEATCADTHRVAGERRDETRTLLAEP